MTDKKQNNGQQGSQKGGQEEVITLKPDDSRTDLIKSKPTMISPVVNADEALEKWNEYQSLKKKLAGKGDFVDIKGKQHPTKQFSNKLSKFFGLSVEIKHAEKEKKGDKDFIWHIWARAIAPNGQFRDSDGHCASDERKFTHLEHDVYSIATTRAKNRAILELAGFGEVSAEEIQDSKPKQKKKTQQQESGDFFTQNAQFQPSDEEKKEKEDLKNSIKENLKVKNIDEKDFKAWLAKFQEGKGRKYVGKLYRNWSLGQGDLDSLRELSENLNRATKRYLDEKEGENNEQQGQKE